ncbi:MAG: OmpA family protein [Pseudomonadota bacterium]
MKQSLATVILLAVLWALGSTWYYDCKIKRVCGPDAVASVAEAESVPAPAITSTTPVDVLPASSAPTVSVAAIALTSAASEPSVTALSLTVFFGRKSTDVIVPADAQAALPLLLKAAAEGRRIVVAGHSDARGKTELKAELSAQRALILKDWLLAQGIKPEAIAAVESREDREPIADNATSEGRAQNRRAVATLVPP